MGLATALLMLAMTPVGSFYDFKVDSIDEKPVNLAKFKGKVLLVVNVASRCGNTPQYTALEETYEKYRKQGFEILGFPANNFGGQEPGSNAEIKQFCTAKYNVKFPMFAKVSVKDADAHPLFQWLVSKSDRPTEAIEWNFGKFLLNRKGDVVARFTPKTQPDAPEVVAAIEKALGEK